MTQTATRARILMLTDAARQLHEPIELAETAVLFDSRTGRIHKAGTPSAIREWSKGFVGLLRDMPMPGSDRLAGNATIVVADFTQDELLRFHQEPRSILRDERVRALPTTPTWHECQVRRIDGVVPAEEAHLAWRAHLDGEIFGRFETHEAAEQALIDETAAIAPLKPRVFPL